ncbi:MAG: hypothetical protein AAGE89_08160 [Pseudomonadota bacterium]
MGNAHLSGNQWLVLAGFIAFTVIASAALALLPKPDGYLLVIASPFETNSAFHVIANSPAAFVGEGLTPSLALAANSFGYQDGLINALYESGAWLVLDGSLYIACFGGLSV